MVSSFIALFNLSLLFLWGCDRGQLLQPGNVRSAHDLSWQVSLYFQSTPGGSNYLYFQKPYLSEKSSHLFSLLKTIKINSKWGSDHYISVYITYLMLLCTSLKHDSQLLFPVLWKAQLFTGHNFSEGKMILDRRHRNN